MNLLKGVSVAVLRPGAPVVDEHGNEVPSEPSAETVENVMPQPGAPHDLGAARPHGVSAAMTFHFPKGYGKSLRGCTILYGGRAYRVVGDPQPFPEPLCPGAHDREVEAEAVDG